MADLCASLHCRTLVLQYLLVEVFHLINELAPLIIRRLLLLVISSPCCLLLIKNFIGGFLWII